MRAALWFLALFGVAVAAALFAGNNEGTVTVFWPPQRIDLSLNLVLFLLVGIFFLLYLALRALSLLLSLPRQARDWRARRQERSLHTEILAAVAHLKAGRYGRARKSAEQVLSQAQALSGQGLLQPNLSFINVMAHSLVAESAHAVQDRQARDEHICLASELANEREVGELNEGLQLSALRWALDDRDIMLAQQRLQELPHGVARRTMALRLKFKLARLAGQTQMALETARLLTKHWTFSDVAGRGMVRGLVGELLLSANDPDKLQQIWSSLDPAERYQPELAIEAAHRLLQLGGRVGLALDWLLPAWDQQAASPAPSPQWRDRLFDVLETAFSRSDAAPDATWLKRIELEQQRLPTDPLIQYLAGVACMRLKLWGKAQSLLSQSLGQLTSTELRRKAWRALAQLAEQRSDADAAAQAWRQAAQE